MPNHDIHPHEPDTCVGCEAVLHLEDLRANLRETNHTLYKWAAAGYPHFPKRLRTRNGRIKVTCRSLKRWKAEVER